MLAVELVTVVGKATKQRRRRLERRAWKSAEDAAVRKSGRGGRGGDDSLLVPIAVNVSVYWRLECCRVITDPMSFARDNNTVYA